MMNILYWARITPRNMTLRPRISLFILFYLLILLEFYYTVSLLYILACVVDMYFL